MGSRAEAANQLLRCAVDVEADLAVLRERHDAALASAGQANAADAADAARIARFTEGVARLSFEEALAAFGTGAGVAHGDPSSNIGTIVSSSSDK